MKQFVSVKKVLISTRANNLAFFKKGASLDAVESCQTRLSILIDDAIKRAPPTHFINIPLEMQWSFSKFRDAALACDPSLDPVLFADATSLHLTVLVLKLYGQKAVVLAKQALAQAVKDFSGRFASTGKSIDVKGLEIMNDDASAVDVLYAKVDTPMLVSIRFHFDLLFLSLSLIYSLFWL